MDIQTLLLVTAFFISFVVFKDWSPEIIDTFWSNARRDMSEPGLYCFEVMTAYLGAGLLVVTIFCNVLLARTFVRGVVSVARSFTSLTVLLAQHCIAIFDRFHANYPDADAWEPEPRPVLGCQDLRNELLLAQEVGQFQNEDTGLEIDSRPESDSEKLWRERYNLEIRGAKVTLAEFRRLQPIYQRYRQRWSAIENHICLSYELQNPFMSVEGTHEWAKCWSRSITPGMLDVIPWPVQDGVASAVNEDAVISFYHDASFFGYLASLQPGEQLNDEHWWLYNMAFLAQERRRWHPLVLASNAEYKSVAAEHVDEAVEKLAMVDSVLAACSAIQDQWIETFLIRKYATKEAQEEYFRGSTDGLKAGETCRWKFSAVVTVAEEDLALLGRIGSSEP